MGPLPDLTPTPIPYLDPNSYTAQRLQHASPHHLHLTARRRFIGPIPEGWLKTHRRDWYRRRFHINYSSRAATFSTDPEAAYRRRLTGHSGASASAVFVPSFPQPRDLAEGDQERGDDDGSDSASTLFRPLPESADSGGDDDGDLPVVPLEQAPSEPRQVQERRTSSHRSLATRLSVKGRKKVPKAGTNSIGPNGAEGIDAPIDTMPHEDEQVRPASSPAHDPGSSRPAQDGRDAPESEPPPDFAGGDHEAEIVPGPSDLRRFRGVHFEDTDESRRARLFAKARAKRDTMELRAEGLFGSRHQKGRILKMEKMLVRVDMSPGTQLPDDFDENYSSTMVTRVVRKWREYMVVCREGSAHGDGIVLQIYKTRVIPELEKSELKKKFKFEMTLDPSRIRVNLFNSLDKTLVLWEPMSSNTAIFLLKGRSAAAGVEWHTFLRHALGWKRPSELEVTVPDLGVNLLLDNPFRDLEESRKVLFDTGGDSTALTKTIEHERAVASRIIWRSLTLLHESPQYQEIVSVLLQKGLSFGLAWRRYDRLEWVHGTNEAKMYGSLAMTKTHDLELRPRRHYATTARLHDGTDLTEPTPVEGFLIRLTSQRGAHQRMGKLFHKRLYFSTHDRYLVFNRPAKAHPPSPPTLPTCRDGEVPSSAQIVEKTPLIFDVDPFPVEHDRITWLNLAASEASVSRHDREAHAEMQRKIDMLAECDGCINLCNVAKVRNVVRGDTVADDNVDEGSDVDYHEAVPDSRQEDGVTGNFDDDRTFELVLRNGLIVRLQAYNRATKNEWKLRLRELVRYWKARTKLDTKLLLQIRKRNLELLRIDEATEAIVGQYARKWEVRNTFASPDIYNMCGPSCCRAIHISGTLFRKPRKHANFVRISAALTQGRLLVFSSNLRSRSGIQVPHIYHEKVQMIDLSDCYIYAGTLTEPQLLYQNRIFDSNHPGRTAVPRLYREDGLTTQDDDLMTTFVIWHSTRRSFFRSQEMQKGTSKSRGSTNSDTHSVEALDGRMRSRVKMVSQLGVTGRNEVFRTRNRVERDRWVLAIGTEIERLQGMEDVRITEQSDKA